MQTKEQERNIERKKRKQQRKKKKKGSKRFSYKNIRKESANMWSKNIQQKGRKYKDAKRKSE